MPVLDWRNLTVLGEPLEPDMFLMDTLEGDSLQGPILDLGCGAFRTSLPLAVRHDLIQGFTGVDANPELIEALRADPMISQLGINVAEASLEKFEIGVGCWGVTICTQTLFLLPKSQAVKVLEQIKIGLKTGGVFYLEVFHRDDGRFLGMWEVEDEKDTFWYDSPCGQHGVVCAFDHDEVIKMFLEDFRCIGKDDGSYGRSDDNEEPKNLVRLIFQKI